jgi:AraC-like DNA-binding protein
MGEPSLSAQFARAVATTGERFGAPADDSLRRMGVPPDADPEAPIPVSRVSDFLDALAVSTGTPHIALELARAVPRGAAGLVDYCFGAAATLFEALLRIANLTYLVGDVYRYELHCEGELSRLVQVNPAPPRAVMALLQGMVAVRVREASREHVRFAAVRFVGDPPGQPAAYDRFFGVRVDFRAAADELVFPTGLLHAPLLTADPTLLRVLRSHPQLRRPRAPREDPLLGRVREQIRARLPGACHAADVARRLGMSTRSLQRKLGELGTSLSDLVDEVRRTLAMTFLEREGVLLADVAARLGFSGLPAFYRAFRRWTGQSPRAFQRREG